MGWRQRNSTYATNHSRNPGSRGRHCRRNKGRYRAVVPGVSVLAFTHDPRRQVSPKMRGEICQLWRPVSQLWVQGPSSDATLAGRPCSRPFGHGIGCKLVSGGYPNRCRRGLNGCRDDFSCVGGDLWWFRDLTYTLFVRGAETPSRRKRSLMAHVSFAPDPPPGVVWRAGAPAETLRWSYRVTRVVCKLGQHCHSNGRVGGELVRDEKYVCVPRATDVRCPCVCADSLSVRVDSLSVLSTPTPHPPLSLARRLVHFLPEQR